MSPSKPKVLLRRAASYDPALIEGILREGMEELGVVPRGRILVKPNCVIANRLFPHAHTRSEFLDGALGAVAARSRDATELAVGERSGITVPTRYAFAAAKYGKVIRRRGFKTYFFDEVPQVEVPLFRPESLRKSIFVPEPVARCEFLVNLPKFKANPWSKVTFALKNYIGIQDDKHRLIDHNNYLDYKIADLQDVVTSRFIAIDGIVGGELNMLTPEPYPLGLIIMGTNSVAVDATCCRIIGLDPKTVTHIVFAHRRNLGPIEASEIDVGGDVSLDEAHEKGKGFRLSTEKIDEIYNGRSRIRAYVGAAPEPEAVLHTPPGQAREGTPYCWGGCPGSFQEAMNVIKVLDAQVETKGPPVHVVIGKYSGTIDAKPGEKVFFVGDCCEYRGTVQGRPIDLKSVYIPRDHRDPHHATSEDLLVKILRYLGNRVRHLGRETFVYRNCPVSVAEQILYLSSPGGSKNPYLDSRIVFPFTWHYTRSLLARGWLRVRQAVSRPAPAPARVRPS